MNLYVIHQTMEDIVNIVNWSFKLSSSIRKPQKNLSLSIQVHTLLCLPLEKNWLSTMQLQYSYAVLFS